MTDIVITPVGQAPVETGGCTCCVTPATPSEKESIVTSKNTVTATYTAPLQMDAVRDAVTEAGYQLVG